MTNFPTVEQIAKVYHKVRETTPVDHTITTSELIEAYLKERES